VLAVLLGLAGVVLAASLAASAEVPPLVMLTCVDEDVAPELTCCMKPDNHAHIVTTLLEQCRALHTTDMAVGGVTEVFSPVLLSWLGHTTTQYSRC
jgi:hypothetical protein